MTDNFTPLPSRRAQRAAREDVDRLAQASMGVPQVPVSTQPSDQLPSRRSRRQQASGLPHDYGYDDFGKEWVTASSTVGLPNAAVTTLHVEQYPTGEISGPIDNTGEIILTGPIVVAGVPSKQSSPVAIDASPQLESLGIPRRATEALSIIGRAAPITENRKISSTGQGITAGFATFLGLAVAVLVWLAFFTDLI
jgi:hypothetical protein